MFGLDGSLFDPASLAALPQWLGLVTLALAAALAASPLPGNSEVVFVALQALGHPVSLLVVVATLANVLGSCATYAMGRWAESFRDSRWFPLRPQSMGRAEAWFARWGRWSLLLSWAPGGDILVALAGLWRIPFGQFLGLMLIAKGARYLVLALITAGIFGAV